MYPIRCKEIYLYLILFIALISSCSKGESLVLNPQMDEAPVKTTVIALLGSSTAAGVGASPRDSSWAYKLQSELIAENKNIRIVNLAVSGYTTHKILPSGFATADTAKNISKALTYNPDLVIISLPSNDMAYGYTDVEIIENYKVIINTIKGANIPFIIMSTQPRNFPPIEARKRLALFNDKLKQNQACHVLNVYHKLANADYFINPLYSNGDGVHLNNKGHDVIFQSVLQDSVFQQFIQ